MTSRKLFGMVVLLLFATSLHAQGVGDYRSVKSDSWSSKDTWQIYAGSSSGWQPATAPPPTTNGTITITIRNSHSVTISTATSIGKTVIDAGGKLTVTSSALTFVNAVAGNKITVNGTLENRGSMIFTGNAVINAGGVFDNQQTLTFNSGSVLTVNGTLKNASSNVNSTPDKLIFNSGSLYLHTATTSGGTIPLATWSTGSTCRISGYTTAVVFPLNSTQSFYNFEWNTPNFSSTAFLVLGSISGNFSVNSTGTGSLSIQGQGLTSVSKAFTVSAGAVNISNLNFQVGGNVTFGAGTTTGSLVTLALNGTTDQTVDVNGFTFGNLTITNPSHSITLASSLKITGDVSIVSSGTTVISNGNLRLLSTSDDGYANDASISTIPNGSSVTGNVVVERYMSNDGNIYRYISSPVANYAVSSLQNDIPVYGNFIGATACPGGGCTTSMYYYNAAGASYIAFPGTRQKNTVTLETGRGYSVLLNQSTLGPVTIHWNGVINQGTINLPVAFNSASPSSSWNLVGNPYPATIDWNKGQVGGTGWTTSSIAQSIAVRDNATGIFQYYPDDVGSETFNYGQIAKGQAFWVRTTAANPTLQINENAKVADEGTFYRKALPDAIDRIVLSLTNGAASDRSYFKIVGDASAKGLDNYDAPKMINTGATSLNLSTLSNGVAMAINAVNDVVCGDTILIRMTGANAQKLASGTYKFSFAASGIMTNHTWMLRDSYLKTTTEISKDGVYTFDVTSNGSSADAGRFKLYATQHPADLALAVTGTTQLCNEDAGSVKIVGAQNEMVYTLVINGATAGTSVQGNGSDLTFVVDAKTLAAGKNSVRVAVNGGCSQAYLRDSLLIVKSDFFTPAVESAKHCQKGAVELKASNVADGNSVRWYATATSTDVLSSSSDFVTPVLTKSKTYYVAGVNAFGCEGARTAVQATIVAFDSVQISTSGLELQSNYPTGNQWYFNGEPIEGATNAAVEIGQDGLYSVTVTIDGCSTTARYSATTTVTAVEPGLSKTIRAYPNPVTNEPIHIEVPAAIQSASLLNDMGAVLVPAIDFTNTSNGMKTTDLELAEYPSGIYLLRVRGAGVATTIKIAKN